MAKKKQKKRTDVKIIDPLITNNIMRKILYNLFVVGQANASNFRNSLIRELMHSVDIKYWDLEKDDDIKIISMVDEMLGGTIVAELLPWGSANVPWKQRFEALERKIRSIKDVDGEEVDTWVESIEEEYPGRKIAKPRIEITGEPSVNGRYIISELTDLWFSYSSGESISHDGKITKDTPLDREIWE